MDERLRQRRQNLSTSYRTMCILLPCQTMGNRTLAGDLNSWDKGEKIFVQKNQFFAVNSYQRFPSHSLSRCTYKCQGATIYAKNRMKYFLIFLKVEQSPLLAVVPSFVCHAGFF